MQAPSVILAGSVALCLTVVGAREAGVRWNPTPSMPMGLWLVRPLAAPLARGDTVSVCLPDRAAKFGRERGYIGSGPCPNASEPLLKDVVAVPGDTVAASPDSIAVNGKPLPMSAGLPHDTENRPMPVMNVWTSVVEAGQVWLLGRDIRSYDSRYYGPVSESNILGIAKRLWTTGG